MSKRKRQRTAKPASVPASSETQTVEMLTVFWMLSLMTGLLCEVGFVLARAYLRLVDPAAARMEILAGMLLFAAAVIGAISLLACGLVVRLRKVPPPRGIIVCGLVIGAAPLVAMLIGSLRHT